MMKICDLHTHVLPGLDDGAQTIEEALQMLRNAAASDVVCLVATPHCNVPYTAQNHLTPELLACFSQLQKAASDIPVRLLLGAEAHVTDSLPRLLRKKLIPTIHQSRYLLTEFPWDFAPEFFPEAIRDITACGYVPLVAHPERYAAVCRNPEIVAQWLDMGCHLQLTGNSILGEYGRTAQRTATYLLRSDYVACVASDAHGTERRNNFLLHVYDHLSVHYSKQYAQCLMYTNPMRICHDETL